MSVLRYRRATSCRSLTVTDTCSGAALASRRSTAAPLFQARSNRPRPFPRRRRRRPVKRVICGFLACDPQLSQAFLGGLPRLIKVNIRDDPSGHWLENSLKFSVTEATNRQAGAAAMLAKLSEVVFAEMLRRYVSGLPEGQTG